MHAQVVYNLPFGDVKAVTNGVVELHGNYFNRTLKVCGVVTD
jgi:hypothetical protein